MKLNTLPIAVTFIASLCPIAGAILNIWPYNVPALLIGLIYIFNFKKITHGSNMLIKYCVPALAILLVGQLLAGRGFGVLANGGYVLIFSVIFIAWFEARGGVHINTLLRGVTSLYKFYMATLLIELILVLFGFQPYLAEFIRSTVAGGYKDYNVADVFHLLGFSKITGLNSIMLGSQIAGMLSLFSIIWFLMLRRYMQKHRASRNSGFWILLSVFLFIMTVNFTGTILAAIAFLIYKTGFQEKVSVRAIVIAIILGAAAVTLISYSGLFDRIWTNDNQVIDRLGPIDDLRESGVNLFAIAGMSTREYYFYVHALPIYNWLNEGLVNQIFGVTIESLLSEIVYTTGDFALGEILYKSGLIWFLIFVISVLYISLPTLRIGKVVNIRDEELRAGLVFCANNALISVLFFASLIHYPQATTNSGPLTLFSLHLAATLYSRRRYWFGGNLRQPIGEVVPV